VGDIIILCWKAGLWPFAPAMPFWKLCKPAAIFTDGLDLAGNAGGGGRDGELWLWTGAWE